MPPPATCWDRFRPPTARSYEIFVVNAKYPATLDEDTAVEVRRLLREEWLAARAQEHIIYWMTAVAEIVVRERRLIDLALDPFRNIGG